MPSPARLFKRFRAVGTNGRLDLNLCWEHLWTHLKNHTRYDHGPDIHGKPRRVLVLVGKLSCWMSESMGKWSVGVGRRHPQGVIQDIVYEASVSAATPDWGAVLSC